MLNEKVKSIYSGLYAQGMIKLEGSMLDDEQSRDYTSVRGMLVSPKNSCNSNDSLLPKADFRFRLGLQHMAY